MEKSQPQFGFPQAKRDDGAKVFMGELTKLNNAGKNSPGPVYNYQDEIKYQQVIFIFIKICIHNYNIQPPGWSFGNAERSGSDKPKYDFYENAAFLDDPL